MSFKEVNSNDLVGSMSKQALSLALNGGGFYNEAGVDGTEQLGVIRSGMVQGKARVIVRASEAYGVAETLAMDLVYETAAGAQVTVALPTLAVANVSGAGEFEVSAGVDVGLIPVGTAVRVDLDYTAGTPNDPRIAVTIELF